MSVRPGFAAAVLALAAALACQHAGPAPGGGPVIVENGDGGVVFPATDAALPGLDGGLELDAGMPGLDGGVIMSFDAG